MIKQRQTEIKSYSEMGFGYNSAEELQPIIERHIAAMKLELSDLAASELQPEDRTIQPYLIAYFESIGIATIATYIESIYQRLCQKEQEGISREMIIESFLAEERNVLPLLYLLEIDISEMGKKWSYFFATEIIQALAKRNQVFDLSYLTQSRRD